MSRPAGLTLVTMIMVQALVGCAAPPGPTATETPPAANLEELVAAVTGDYVSIRAVGDDSDTVSLRVAPERDAHGLALLMTQQRTGTQRDFRLELQASSSPDRFNARFIPLPARRGPAAPACDMRFALAGGRLVGETDPDTCRFQSGELNIGLLKEIAFERDRILMADQLLHEDGTPFAEPDRLELRRTAQFSGTLAQRDGSVWRVAQNLGISSGGNLVEPLDAAGMSLGLLLNLEFINSPALALPALRLQILDEATGQAKAEVWNTIDTRLIGLRLDDLRIDLQRQPDRFDQP